MKRSALLAALTACSLFVSTSPTSSAGPVIQPTYPKYANKVTIKWWSWTLHTETLIKAFEKQYPNIRVLHENVGYLQTEYSKLLTVIKAGAGAPDLTQLVIDAVPQFIATGGLRDVAPLGANRYRPYFLPWTWNQVSSGRSVYAIPEDSGPLALFYNANTFKKYGLTVPKTWNDFSTDAAKLHKVNPQLYMSFFTFNNGSWINSLLWAAGAHPYSTTGSNSWKVNLTSPVIQRVMTFWGKMISLGYVQPAGDFSADWIKNLQSGKYASFVGAAWSTSYELGPYVKPNSGWKVAPLPQWSSNKFIDGNWGGSVNAVTMQSKHPDAALLFAAWINTHAQAIHYNVLPGNLGGRGLWPADKYALNDPYLHRPDPILSGQRSDDVFVAASNAVDTSFQWTPWTSYANNEYTVEFGKAMNGQESWNQALATIQAAVTRYGETQGYTVTQ